MPQEHALNVQTLDPRAFENLIFDLLQASGMMNLTWRTPGADGGRDIEGVVLSHDVSGYATQQLWYVECKRYSATIDWPTVWRKIAYAENQRADFLLLATNSNPSPQCESEIDRWNARRQNPQVRLWRGYDLDRLFTLYPTVAAKYGLRHQTAHLRFPFLDLVTELMKFVQTAYVAEGLSCDSRPPLEAAAAVSELLAHRLDDLQQYGHQVTSGKARHVGSYYEWVEGAAGLADLEELSARALLSVYRHVTGASVIRVESLDSGAAFHAERPRFPLTSAARRTLQALALWTPFDVTVPVPLNASIRVSPRLAPNGGK